MLGPPGLGASIGSVGEGKTDTGNGDIDEVSPKECEFPDAFEEGLSPEGKGTMSDGILLERPADTVLAVEDEDKKVVGETGDVVGIECRVREDAGRGGGVTRVCELDVSEGTVWLLCAVHRSSTSVKAKSGYGNGSGNLNVV